ncbi:MAG TPA: hypothetical protein VGV38_21465, partial [Pyrinomonadaceae bacterium]|nr:hypothetical protein [Pyrinomonadaceae bacterium]
SYGIEVARLAGLPPSVLARARDVLSRLERYELAVFAEEATQTPEATATNAKGPDETRQPTNGDHALQRAAGRARSRAVAAGLTLFDSVNQSLLDELRGVDVETLSAEEVRQMVLDIRRRMV